MIMKTRLILLLSILLSCLACEDTQTLSGYSFAFTEATQTSVTVTSDAEDVALSFEAPATWSAEAIDLSTSTVASWVSLSPSSGSAGDNLSITATISANASTASRSARVSIVCNDQTLSVLIKQSGADGSGVELTSEAELYADADYDYVNPLTLDFVASGSWTISVKDIYDVDPAWLTIDKYSGVAGEYSLEMMVADNTVISERSATISIESNGDVATVLLTQSGAMPYELSLSYVSSTAGIITVEVDPGDYTGIYYVTRYSTDSYDEYGYTPEVFMQALLDKYIGYGFDMTTPNGYSLFQGKQTIDLSVGYWLDADTKYNIFAAGISGSDAVINSEVEMITASTQVLVENTDLTFEYSTGEVWLDWAEVTAKPSVDGVEYFMGVDWLAAIDFDYEGAWYTDEQDYMEQMAWATGLNRSDYVHTTEYSTTWEGLSGDNEFIIYTFAIDGNLPCSKLHYGTFWTFDGMMDLYGYHIDVEQSYTTTEDVFINMDPDDYTGVYYLGMYPYDSYVSYSGDVESLARVMVEFEMNYQGVDDFTVADDKRFFKGVKKDASLYTAWPGINAGWSYMLLVFGINEDTTIPTDISTMMVVAGAGYGAPQSISEQDDTMIELEKFARGRYNGESIVNTIIKNSAMGKRTVQSVSDPIGKALLLQRLGAKTLL